MQHTLSVLHGVLVGVVGEDGVDLPAAEWDVGGVDPHLVLHGMAAAVGLGHVVVEAGCREALGGGDDVGRRADLDAEMIRAATSPSGARTAPA